VTPTATRLQARLDERRRWFQNEWFFKWHFIGKDGPVSIESFDGRGIHLGGIMFDGSARLTYWDTVTRGVRKEITEQFAWVDEEVRKYTAETALRAIDECARELATFARIIRREAIKKDRILRGDGIRFPPEDDAGQWQGTSPGEIQKQADALKAALPLTASVTEAPMPVEESTFGQRATKVWHDNQWWLGPVAFVVGLAGLALPFL
jgi:hypothetical protein